MADVNHAHPITGRTFGAAFQRGPAVADGGEVPHGSDPTDGAEERETMRAVDHTPPHGEAVTDVWSRGESIDGHPEEPSVHDTEDAPADE